MAKRSTTIPNDGAPVSRPLVVVAPGDTPLKARRVRIISDEEGLLRELFASRDDLSIRIEVATALFNKGFSLGARGHSDEEIAVYDDLLARFGGAQEFPIRKLVAKTLFNKGVTLDVLGRSDEATVAFTAFREAGEIFRKVEKFEHDEKRRQEIAAFVSLVARAVAAGLDVQFAPELPEQEKDELVSRVSGYAGPKRGDDTPPAEARGFTAPGDLSGINVATDTDLEGTKSYTTEEAQLLLGELSPALTGRGYRKRNTPLPEELRKAAGRITSNAARRRAEGVELSDKEKQIVRVSERLLKADRAARKKLAKPEPSG